MNAKPKPVDILVIGSGIAGLRLALAAAEGARVRVVTKGRDYQSNTDRAQGGIAAVLAADDDFDLHVKDTLTAGAGLCHEPTVRAMVERAPAHIEDLIQLGIRFSRGEGGDYALGREGGHSRRRVIHAGDFTGRELARALVLAARSHPSIQLLEDHFAVDLLKDENGRVAGALILDERREVAEIHRAPFTVIAAGGTGKVYRYTSNPDIATGDGLAMAYRGGATLSNLEFVQFHPTCLFHPKAKSFLISEAVRGEGAVLRHADGEAFMARHHELADLAPRDIVARAIDSEMKQRGVEHVLLDTTVIPADHARERFPNIRRRCLEYGFDLTEEPLPVVPAAHYSCGGVVTDAVGATDLPGLYVVGESAMTGAHGANRLASNSLLEALHFAHACAADILEKLAEDRPPMGLPVVVPDLGQQDRSPTPLLHDWEVARRTMWNYVGIQRDVSRLSIALERMTNMARLARQWCQEQRLSVDLCELRNVTLLGELTVRCALFRRESRGLHALRDFPELDDRNFLGDTLVKIGREPELRFLQPEKDHETRECL